MVDPAPAPPPIWPAWPRTRIRRRRDERRRPAPPSARAGRRSPAPCHGRSPDGQDVDVAVSSACRSSTTASQRRTGGTNSAGMSDGTSTSQARSGCRTTRYAQSQTLAPRPGAGRRTRDRRRSGRPCAAGTQTTLVPSSRRSGTSVTPSNPANWARPWAMGRSAWATRTSAAPSAGQSCHPRLHGAVQAPSRFGQDHGPVARRPTPPPRRRHRPRPPAAERPPRARGWPSSGTARPGPGGPTSVPAGPCRRRTPSPG